MFVAGLAARTRRKLMWLRGLHSRAFAGLPGDSQGPEITSDQWIAALIESVAEGVGSIGWEAGQSDALKASPGPSCPTVCFQPPGQRPPSSLDARRADQGEEAEARGEHLDSRASAA